MSTNTKQSKKYLSLVTYCIALVCLILGLLLPVFDGEMLCTMLPSAFCSTFGIDMTEMVGTPLSAVFPLQIAGISEPYDVMSLAIFLYAVVTLVGIIMLIPVIASKRTSKTASVCAYIVEIAAATVLFAFALMDIELYVLSGAWHWCVTALAFGGTLLMLAIQSIGNKKGSGVMKVIVAVIGALTVMCLFNLVFLWDIDTMWGDVATGLLGPIDGLTFLYTFLGTGIEGLQALEASAQIIACAAALLIIVNFVIDIVNVGANSSKGGLVFDVIRYVLQTILLVVSMALFHVSDILTAPGVLIYFAIGLSAVMAIIGIIRAAAFKPETAQNADAPAADYFYDDTVTEAAAPAPASAPAPAPAPVVYQQPVYVAPAPVYQKPAYQPAAPANTSREIVYNAKEVYHGPTDAFIARLTDSEKIEFAKLFLEKINGPYANIPDYVIGGDNREFFSSIFIYLGKFRSVLSDGLMNKIYNELNLLN